jgi:ActR/RegA family two-component response regulator
MSDVAAKKAEGRLLTALRVVDAKKWASKIRRAMTAAEGRIPDAAEALGVHERTLYRWLDATDDAGAPIFGDVTRAAVGERRSH